MTRTDPERVVVAAVLTCHNREATTARFLRSLEAVDIPERVDLHVFVCDDGSTDGTSTVLALARERNLALEVVRGTGHDFWTGGMLRAIAAARVVHPNYLWFLNDDLELRPSALQALLLAVERGGGVVGIGSVTDLQGRTIYGGLQRTSTWHPLRLSMASSEAERVSTFHGNCLLINRDAYESIGGLDGRFPHALADLDLGYRLIQQHDYRGVVVPDCAVGTFNQDIRGHYRPGLRLAERLAEFRDIRAFPTTAWWLFCRRHAGPIAPLIWVIPYAKMVGISVLDVGVRLPIIGRILRPMHNRLTSEPRPF